MPWYCLRQRAGIARILLLESLKGAPYIIVLSSKKTTTMGYHHLQGDMSAHTVNGNVPLHQQSDNTLF